MLAVESRPHLSNKSLPGSRMDVFDKQVKKSSSAKLSDTTSKKQIAKSVVKTTVKTEVVIVRENGGKPNQDPTASSMSPEQPRIQALVALQRTFGRVVISLENLILPDDRLCPTPSMVEGLDSRTEWFLRRIGCDMIQHAGILLKLPQTAMATAQVLYQRFYHIKSFLRHDYFTIAMACIYLASKVEEFPKRLRDIINVFTHIRQTLCSEPIEPVILDYHYVLLKNQIIKCERRLLKELGFCVHVKHPHKLICMYLQVLNLDRNQTVVQRAWNYMNDSLRTDLFVRYSPEAIACGCIFLAARKLQIPLPRKHSWSSLFGITEEEMRNIATNILLLYSIKLPPVLEIEEKINCMRTAIEKARNKGPLANVIDLEAERTPDSIQTTPEDLQATEAKRRESKEEDSRDRGKRQREASPVGDRLSSRDSKRRRSPLVHSRNARRTSQSQSKERHQSHDQRSKDRRRSPSPIRVAREKPFSSHGDSPLIGRRDRSFPNRRDRDDRRRSKDSTDRKRSRSRSVERHRRDRRF